VKRAIFGALGSLALLGFPGVPPANAQQEYPPEGPVAPPGLVAEAEGAPGYPVLDDPALAEASGGCDEFCAGDPVFGDHEVGCCCAVCGGGNCPPSTWYWRHEVRVLAASKVRNQKLTDEFIGFDQDGRQVFSSRLGTKSVDFDVAAGYAVTVGRYLGRDSENRDHFLEFRYWGMNHWQVGRQVTGERIDTSFDFTPGDPFDPLTPVVIGSLFSPFDDEIGGFNRADLHEIHYDLEVHNWEVNARFVPRSRPDRLVLHPSGHWRRECTPGDYFSFLVGLRVMSLREGFHWSSRGSVAVNGVPNPISGDYVMLTHNDMFGAQIGADYTARRCKWQYGVRVKAGPYINFADQRSRATTSSAGDPFATVDLDFARSKKRDDAGFVGEFGFFSSYKIKPNLSVNAAYDFMWVLGLARAPEQVLFQADPPVELNTNGHTYFHGLSLGLEWCW